MLLEEFNTLDETARRRARAGGMEFKNVKVPSGAKRSHIPKTLIGSHMHITFYDEDGNKLDSKFIRSSDDAMSTIGAAADRKTINNIIDKMYYIGYGPGQPVSDVEIEVHYRGNWNHEADIEIPTRAESRYTKSGADGSEPEKAPVRGAQTSSAGSDEAVQVFRKWEQDQDISPAETSMLRQRGYPLKQGMFGRKKGWKQVPKEDLPAYGKLPKM